MEIYSVSPKKSKDTQSFGYHYSSGSSQRNGNSVKKKLRIDQENYNFVNLDEQTNGNKKEIQAKKTSIYAQIFPRILKFNVKFYNLQSLHYELHFEILKFLNKKYSIHK